MADYSNMNPYAGINFIEFNPIITDRDGNVKFKETVIFPDFFSENSVKIVASKYLANSAKKKELTLTAMIDRVADTVVGWTHDFLNEEERSELAYKIKFYHVNQYFSFNSPVYFNIGTNDGEPGTEQLSACFITQVDDNMDSITDWIASEAKIFKYGSGSGTNLSRIRSSKERVKQGGFASGPISFLKAADTMAGVIRSGGTFRRAAKMAMLNIDHPDIFNFIVCKDKEEEKLRVLKESGVNPADGYELSDEVFFQNTNISVRITDEFMKAVEEGRDWQTKEVLTGKPVDTISAKELLMAISRHAWTSGDPGVMFHDTINEWNTLPAEGEIEASNPCGEYNSFNNTSCNLAALNYLRFFSRDHETKNIRFNYNMFYDVIKTSIIAQDTFIDNAYYPTEKIADNTKFYRALGFGFSNLGAVFMYLGIPYDSDEARKIASLLTSLITGIAYRTSMFLAEKVGPGQWWNNAKNQNSMLQVLKKHRQHVFNIPETDPDSWLHKLQIASHEIWDDLCENFRPLRNSQVTLVAPTGTTGFLMGCEFFGIEPSFGLITYKTLSGNDGAVIKNINTVVPEAFISLGYDDITTNKILYDFIEKDIPIENNPLVKPEHVAVFDTAVPSMNGTRQIHYMGHIKMMCAVQPFVSSAISKTINLANNATVEDIFNIYLYTWKNGLKSITIYRDGSKTEQILNISDTKDDVDNTSTEPVPLAMSVRKKLPSKRKAETNKFTIYGVEGKLDGYITRGFYPNGDLGEVFIELSKDGAVVKGLVGAIVTLTSISLQYGVPLAELVEKMIYRRFEPSGWVKGDEYVRSCNSIVDYIFKHLAFNHLPDEELMKLGLKHPDQIESSDKPNITTQNTMQSESICPNCGAQLRKLGGCNFCISCAWQSGTCS